MWVAVIRSRKPHEALHWLVLGVLIGFMHAVIIEEPQRRRSELRTEDIEYVHADGALVKTDRSNRRKNITEISVRLMGNSENEIVSEEDAVEPWRHSECGEVRNIGGSVE